MWEIIESEDTEKDTIIPMCDMKPMQVGVIVGGEYRGAYATRTQSSAFEVVNLSDPGAGMNWGSNYHLKVRLLRKGESITVKLFNEE